MSSGHLAMENSVGKSAPTEKMGGGEGIKRKLQKSQKVLSPSFMYIYMAGYATVNTTSSTWSRGLSKPQFFKGKNIFLLNHFQ